MRDFLVSGTMPFILVMSVYFLVRFVMYLLPSKSKGTFLFKAQWHFKKPWLIVPTVVLVVVYTGFGLWFSADKIADSGLERILQWCLLCLPILWVVLMFLPEKSIQTVFRISHISICGVKLQGLSRSGRMLIRLFSEVV